MYERKRLSKFFLDRSLSVFRGFVLPTELFTRKQKILRKNKEKQFLCKDLDSRETTSTKLSDFEVIFENNILNYAHI